jgi:F-type H+-transporting ATPase subunit epsilon
MAVPAQFTFELVTPDRGVVTEQVDEVQLPGIEGYLGILPGHTPLLTQIAAGELWYRKGQQRVFLSVAYGIAEVLPERVTILALSAERAEEIDTVRAQAARQRAEAAMRQSSASPQDIEVARMALLRSLSRLQVATRARTRG